MSDNPFAAPEATVTDIQTRADAGLLRDLPRKNPFSHGLKWIKEGFDLFKKSPLFWIINIVIYMVIIMLLSILPLVSLFASVVNPVFTGGLLYGAHELDQGRPLTVGHLFEGFRRNTGSLFAVGGLYLLGLIVIMIIAGIVAFSTGTFDAFSRAAMQQGEIAPQLDMMSNMLLPALIYLALVIPLAMAIWFAPILIMLHDMNAIEAMKRSFDGCLKNMLPYLLFGIVGLILIILGLIPLGLGLLVVIPLMTAAMYASYKDIFLD